MLASISLVLATMLQNEAPKVTLDLPASGATVGRGLKGTLVVEIPEGLHGYQNPPADEFENPIRIVSADKGFKVYKATYPKGVEFKMAGAQKPSLVYEGTIRIPVILIPTTSGDRSLKLKLDYQFCNANSCFPPNTVEISAPVKVAPALKKAKA